MIKKFFASAILLSLFMCVMFLTGCSDDSPAQIIVDPDATLTELPPIWDVPPRPDPENMAADVTTNNLLQLTPLTRGELLVTMHTNMGDIVLRFFPTEAPKAVENFLTHAWDGYYDRLIFHRVIPDFMIQGGCSEGTGAAGQSIWGTPFAQEFSTELRHFRGALAMAHAGPNTQGSQFYIVQNTNLASHFQSDFIGWLETQDEVMEEYPDGSTITVGDVFPSASLRYFIDNGGVPHLDWHFNNNAHTVFGHVVSGMDVVDAIAATPTSNDRPVNDVIINGFTFHTYQGGS